MLLYIAKRKLSVICVRIITIALGLDYHLVLYGSYGLLIGVLHHNLFLSGKDNV